MKSINLSHAFLALGFLFYSDNSFAQNVGIGTAVPLDKLHVVGNIRSTTLAGVGNRLVLADPNGTLIAGGTPAGTAWLVTGNAGLNGGNITTAGTNFLGTTDAQNIDFRTNNLYRGRFSSLGEFFVGALNTVIPGDLMNAVGNPTFYWAVNGYSPAGVNGGAVYGQIQAGNTTVFGGVQGEYYGSNAGGAGVRGISALSSGTGVSAQEPTLVGWGVLSNGDIGAILPGNFYTVSDARLKSNITPLSNSLQKIVAMKGYTYDVNQHDYPKYFPTNRKSVGFLAQELEQILPEAVTEKYISTPNTNRENPDKQVESMKVKAVSYNSVIPVLVEAIKEQQVIINGLKDRIQQLEENK
ncbi:MAG: tail fiber domain-containing protein [Bacteroidetes bacterium]|nr:tail fiber domain-containing protein [Bacteroidota bacterium]